MRCFSAAGKFRKDDIGEYFTELNAPLIKTVETPDDTLNEDLMFIERYPANQLCAGSVHL